MRVAILLGLLAVRAASVAIDIDADVDVPEGELSKPDLPVGEVGWSGAVVPGGPEVEYWGDSLEDIEAKIKIEHPEFSILDESIEDDDDYVSPIGLKVDENGDPITENPAVKTRTVLERRKDFSYHKCKKSLGWGDVGGINDGAIALKKHKGKCKAKPRTCIRMKCHSRAAIGVCNYNKHTISLACSHVARGIPPIRRDCHKFEHFCRMGLRGIECEIINHKMAGENWSVGKTWKVIAGTCKWYGKGTTRPLKL